jgi:hypothetical protein
LGEGNKKAAFFEAAFFIRNDEFSAPALTLHEVLAQKFSNKKKPPFPEAALTSTKFIW